MGTKLPFLIPNYTDSASIKWSEGPSYPDPDGSGNFVANLTGDVTAMVLTFGIVAGQGGAGTGVTLPIAAPRAASITKCKVVVKASDATVDFQFRIKQNGADIFSTDPTVPHGSAAGVQTFTSFTSSPLAVAADDVFTLDIISGSATWALAIQLETA